MSLIALTLAGTVSSTVAANERAIRLAKLLVQSQALQADTADAWKACQANANQLEGALAKRPVIEVETETGVSLPVTVLLVIGGIAIGAVVGGTLVLINE